MVLEKKGIGHWFGRMYSLSVICYALTHRSVCYLLCTVFMGEEPERGTTPSFPRRCPLSVIRVMRAITMLCAFLHAFLRHFVNRHLK